MVSSASSQIEASMLFYLPKFISLILISSYRIVGGDNLRTTIIKDGVPTNVPDYGAVRHPLFSKKTEKKSIDTMPY